MIVQHSFTQTIFTLTPQNIKVTFKMIMPVEERGVRFRCWGETGMVVRLGSVKR